MFVDRFLQKGAVAGGVATVVEDEGLDSVAMDTACGVDRGRPRLKGAGAATDVLPDDAGVGTNACNDQR